LRTLITSVLACAVLAGPVTAGAAEPVSLASGELEARVSAEPFGLELLDRSDGDSLRTISGVPRPDDRNARYGPLGYSMDLRMPVVDGATAIRQLAERASAARVLVLTTYDTDADVVPALEAGATDYPSRTRRARS